MAKKESAPDWEAIERTYRAGVLSLREIAALHPGSNHTAIARHAKREGWVRDLASRIKAKANDLVTRQSVTKPVTAEQRVTDTQIVDANAQVIADIRIAHRSDIRSGRALTMALFRELEVETGDIASLIKLGELMEAPDEKGVDKLRDLYLKVISLPSRTDTMKKLSETLKNLIALERQAFGIEDGATGTGSHESAIDELA